MARQNIPNNGLWSAIASLINANTSELYTAQSFGIYDYNDLSTQTTPISIAAPNTWYNITNDGAGAYTNKTYALSGVPDVWDSATNSFVFTDLELGDTVDIRLDVFVTSTSLNQTFDIDLVLGFGTAGQYRVPFIIEQQFKSTGSRQLTRFSSIYMGDSATRDNPGKFQVRSSDTGSIRVNGWYCRVNRARKEAV